MNDFDDYLSGKKFLGGTFETDDMKLMFSTQKNKVLINANKEGLICLAKYLIDYAYNEMAYSGGLHLYSTNKNFLETLDEGSLEVVIKKTE